MPKKPSGIIGPVVLKATLQGLLGGLEKIKFSSAKEDIERFIADLWAREIRRTGGSILDVKQNSDQNDFDLTIELPGGFVFLDLVEVIYRDSKGRPYDNDDVQVKVFDFAEQIRDTVLKKSRHYGKVNSRPIHLLLYVTHWRFWPIELVVRLAQYLLLQTPPITENVFLLMPLDSEAAVCRVLFPSENPLEGRDPEEFREQLYFALDPTKAEVVVQAGVVPTITATFIEPLVVGRSLKI